MIVVKLLRWFLGFFDFTVAGRFPERVMNLASRRGVNLWNLEGEKETLYATAKLSDLPLLEDFAKKTGTVLTVERQHGFPHLCRVYQQRLGLLTGAIIGSLLILYLSGFVWNIQIQAPEGINEYEIRNQLAQLGLYEGARYPKDQITETELKLRLMDDRISWLSINDLGTTVEVAMSLKETPERQSDIDLNACSHLKSKADGIITKVSVTSGKAAVQVGDGVHKGQLLVNGIITFTDGSSRFYDSSGVILAKTSRRVTFTIPRKTQRYTFSDQHIYQNSIQIFHALLPLTLCEKPTGEINRTVCRRKLSPDGGEIPIVITTADHVGIITWEIPFTAAEAKKKLLQKKQLYELFLCGSGQAKVLDSSTDLTETEDAFIFTVNYTIEEDIAEKSYFDYRPS